MKNQSLKPGRRQVKFGDVVQLSKARCADPLADGIERFVGLEHLEPGDLRIRRWGNVADGVTFTSLFKSGQVLFGKRRAYQRKVAVADFSGVCSGDIYVLESKDANTLLPELLPFICQTDAFFEHAVGTSAGSLSPRTNWTSLADFEFSLPSPDEQRNIVRLAHAHQACSESYKQLVGSIESLLMARTHEIFASGVKATSRSRQIGDIADVQYGLTVNAKRREADNLLPYLRVANTQRFKFDLAEIKTIGIEQKDSDCRLKRGDILVVEGHADINELGRAAMWEEQIPLCYHQNHLIRIRCREDAVARYVLEYVNSPAGRAYFRKQGKSTSGLNTLNSRVVREMQIPIPSLDEQSAIAEELQAGRHALEAATSRYQQAIALRKMAIEQALGAS